MILVSKIQYTLPFTCNLIQCLGQLQFLYFTLRIWTWENLDMVGPRLCNCMMHTCECIFIHTCFFMYPSLSIQSLFNYSFVDHLYNIM